MTAMPSVQEVTDAIAACRVDALDEIVSLEADRAALAAATKPPIEGRSVLETWRLCPHD